MASGQPSDGFDPDCPAWTREQASRLQRTPRTVAPATTPPETGLSEEVYAWDTWLLRGRDGSIATVGDYRLLFALTAPRDRLPGKRHDVAQLRCFYSSDGRTWHDAGPVFDGGALGSRQWAGCAVLDQGEPYVYYTAAGRRGETDLSYSQRIALATGGRLLATTDGIRIDRSWEHDILLEPDGDLYETEAQSRGMIYTFRDPWFFEDPNTGETHLLFEANLPIPEDSQACGGDHLQQEFNGCVGIADSPTGDPTDFHLRPPLLHSTCVNQELERPHVIVMDGRYYLFVSSHEHTFAPGIHGFDALYGFVAESLRGAYRPLNDSGLVLTNPATEPFQAYSWLAYAHRDEVLVTGFVNYYDLGGRTLDEVADLSPAEQHRRFGGTPTPTVRLSLGGETSRIRGILAHGHLPLPDESLTEASGIESPTAAELAESEHGRSFGGSYAAFRSGEYRDSQAEGNSSHEPRQE